MSKFKLNRCVVCGQKVKMDSVPEGIDVCWEIIHFCENGCKAYMFERQEYRNEKDVKKALASRWNKANPHGAIS